MWPLVIVLLDEFPMELESRMLEVVGSEPSFDLSEGRRLADAAEMCLMPFSLLFASKLDSPFLTL